MSVKTLEVEVVLKGYGNRFGNTMPGKYVKLKVEWNKEELIEIARYFVKINLETAFH